MPTSGEAPSLPAWALTSLKRWLRWKASRNLLALRVGAAELHQLADDDRPGAEREEDQEGEDDLRHRPRLQEEAEHPGLSFTRAANLEHHQSGREHAIPCLPYTRVAGSPVPMFNAA